MHRVLFKIRETHLVYAIGALEADWLANMKDNVGMNYQMSKFLSSDFNKTSNVLVMAKKLTMLIA